MKTKEIITVKATKHKQNQTSQKNSIIHDNVKNGINTLIKLIRLMEVTGRQNFIKTRG